MKIIVDAMGGDHAPLEIVKGAAAAARKRSDLTIVLVGKEEEVKKAAAQCGQRVAPSLTSSRQNGQVGGVTSTSTSPWPFFLRRTTTLVLLCT